MVQGNYFSIMGNNEGSFMTKISKVSDGACEEIIHNQNHRFTLFLKDNIEKHHVSTDYY